MLFLRFLCVVGLCRRVSLLAYRPRVWGFQGLKRWRMLIVFLPFLILVEFCQGVIGTCLLAHRRPRVCGPQGIKWWRRLIHIPLGKASIGLCHGVIGVCGPQCLRCWQRLIYIPLGKAPVGLCDGIIEVFVCLPTGGLVFVVPKVSSDDFHRVILATLIVCTFLVVNRRSRLLQAWNDGTFSRHNFFGRIITLPLTWYGTYCTRKTDVMSAKIDDLGAILEKRLFSFSSLDTREARGVQQRIL